MVLNTALILPQSSQQPTPTRLNLFCTSFVHLLSCMCLALIFSFPALTSEFLDIWKSYCNICFLFQTDLFFFSLRPGANFVLKKFLFGKYILITFRLLETSRKILGDRITAWALQVSSKFHFQFPKFESSCNLFFRRWNVILIYVPNLLEWSTL
jgi:hypothetical protein